MISFLLYKLSYLSTRLLPLRVIYGFATFLAHCHFMIDFRARAAVRGNLSRVWGGEPPSPTEQRRCARRVFLNFSHNVVDFLRVPNLTRDRFLRLIEVEGLEHLEAAHRRGRGVLVLSAHFGNWEWGAMLIARVGYDTRAVALDHASTRVTRLFAEHRRSQGVETFSVHGSSFAIIKALRRGDVVATAGDREVLGQGIRLPFFGEPTLVPRAHASLAVKTGAAIVPAFMLRLPGGRFRTRFLPAVQYDDLPEAERVRRLVERCLQVIEDQIRAHPDQWFVFLPLWDAGVDEAKSGQTGADDCVAEPARGRADADCGRDAADPPAGRAVVEP